MRVDEIGGHPGVKLHNYATDYRIEHSESTVIYRVIDDSDDE